MNDNQIKNYFFLISYPRSGNTWASILLSNYLFIQFAELNGNNNAHGEIYTIKDNNINLNVKMFGHKNHQIFPDSIEYDPQCYLGIKTHFDLDKIYKNIKGQKIYLIRDPKDVMLSYYFYKNSFKTKSSHVFDESKFYLFIQKYLIEWKKHATLWLKRNVLYIKYEDIKKNPAIILESFKNSLKIKKIKKPIDIVLRDHVYSVEYMTQNNSKFFRKGIIGDHKNYYSDKIYSFFDDTVGELLELLRYN